MFRSIQRYAPSFPYDRDQQLTLPTSEPNDTTERRANQLLVLPSHVYFPRPYHLTRVPSHTPSL